MVPGKAHCRIGGFTMVEVVIVVLIVGVLAALAIPVSTGILTRMKVSSAADQIVTALQLARSRAMSDQSQRCGVYFNFTSRAYSIFFDTSPKNGDYDAGDPLFRPAESLPAGVEFYEPASTPITPHSVVYRGDGVSNRGGRIGVRKTGAATGKEIKVNTSTGTVQYVAP